MRECFGNYPNTIGFPCRLCEDESECSGKNTAMSKAEVKEIDIVDIKANIKNGLIKVVQDKSGTYLENTAGERILIK